MSTANPAAYPNEFHPYGLPMGTVRGFLSVLICLFFWIVLLSPVDNPLHAPLSHFFLLSLVFLAFASHPMYEAQSTAFLPWLMKALFIGGSAVVLIYVAYKQPAQLAARLTPNAGDIGQWPVLLGCFTGGFGIALFTRFILGRRNELFQTARAWLGILAILLLIFEIVFQFVIIPNMSDAPAADVMKIWEGFLVAVVAAYFGCRA
jgi:hypothetical protein